MQALEVDVVAVQFWGRSDDAEVAWKGQFWSFGATLGGLKSSSALPEGCFKTL